MTVLKIYTYSLRLTKFIVRQSKITGIMKFTIGNTVQDQHKIQLQSHRRTINYNLF